MSGERSAPDRRHGLNKQTNGHSSLRSPPLRGMVCTVVARMRAPTPSHGFILRRTILMSMLNAFRKETRGFAP